VNKTDQRYRRLTDTTRIDIQKKQKPSPPGRAVVGVDETAVRQTQPSPTVKMLRRLVGSSRYQEFLQNMYDGVLMTDQKGRMVDINLRAIKLFRCSKPELSQLNIIDLIPGADEGLLAQINEILRSEKHVILDASCRRPDGTNFPSEIAVSMLHVTEDGQLCFFVRDITQRKKAELMLARERDLLQALMNNIPDRIYFKDTKCRFLRINQSLATVLGLSRPEEAIGKTDFDFHDEVQAQKFRMDDEKVIQTGVPIIDKVEKIMNSDGSLRWSSTTKVPIRDEKNNIIGLVGVSRDITDRMHAEEELKTAETQFDRVRRLEATSLFAGQIAHDFNNLLVPLLIYPRIIRKDLKEGTRAFEDLELIENTARQIADINQDLLALSRRGNVQQEVLSINSMVEEIVETFRKNITPKKIEIDCIASAKLPNVLFGGPQLTRVLQNLCQNAIEAMGDEGHLIVKTDNIYLDRPVGKYVRVNSGEYARITVSDNGCGIPDNIKDRIFDPFFTTKVGAKERGSGLGLSVVYGIVTDHKGYIDMESTVGIGTTFSLYFPVCRSEILKETGLEVSGGTEKILIVDDDPFQIEAFSRILEELGYKVTGVHSGEEAVRLFENCALEKEAAKNGQRSEGCNFPDLVILDMVMRDGVDGTETYKRIKKINPSQKVITVSGYREHQQVTAVQALGAGQHLCKPVTFESVAQAVRQELDRS